MWQPVESTKHQLDVRKKQGEMNRQRRRLNSRSKVIQNIVPEAIKQRTIS